jgi:hypothetical protein
MKLSKFHRSVAVSLTALAVGLSPVVFAAPQPPKPEKHTSEARQTIKGPTQKLAKANSESLNSKGYASKVAFTGKLKDGGSEVIHLYFYAGAEYVASASGDENTQGISVAVFGDDKKVVASDEQNSQEKIGSAGSTAVATTTFKAPYTGDYYVKVTLLKSSSGSGGEYALTLGYK